MCLVRVNLIALAVCRNSEVLTKIKIRVYECMEFFLKKV